MNRVALNDLDKYIQHNFSKRPALYLLFGEVGSGKTTFVQHFLKYLGVKTTHITSPTFSLINHYQADHHIFHLDLYRLKSSIELESINIDEILNNEQAIKIIEWPEILLPINQNHINIQFEHDQENDFRKIKIQK